MDYVLIEKELKVKADILKDFNNFRNNIANNSVTYNHSLTIDIDVLNYINTNNKTYYDRTVKNLIIKEAYSLENFSYGLGSKLINLIGDYLLKYPSTISDKYQNDKNFVEFKNNFILNLSQHQRKKCIIINFPNF